MSTPVGSSKDLKRETLKRSAKGTTRKGPASKRSETPHDDSGVAASLNRPFPMVGSSASAGGLEELQASKEISEARAYADAIIETLREPLIVLDRDLHVRKANQAFYDGFHVSPDEAEGRLLYDLGNGQWEIPKLRTLFEEILPKDNRSHDFKVEHDFERLGRCTMLLNARRLNREDGSTDLILLTIENVTERQLGGAATASLAAIVTSSDDAIIGKDLNGVITSWNNSAERLFGYTAQEAIGQSITMLIPADRQGEEPEILARLRRGERIEHFETVRVRKDGSQLEVSLTSSPIKDATGRVIGASKIARDISERKQAEEALRQSHIQLQSHAEELERFESGRGRARVAHD